MTWVEWHWVDWEMLWEEEKKGVERLEIEIGEKKIEKYEYYLFL